MKTFLKSFPALFMISLPTMFGYLFFGMSYGFLMQQIQMSLLSTLLFSALVYGGSIQYMALPWLVAPLPILSMMIISMLVNIRHIFYSMSLHERFKQPLLPKSWAIFTLSDETFTMWQLQTQLPFKSMLVVSTLHYGYWMMAGVLGHSLASMVSFDIKGLDFVLTALFFSALLSKVSDLKSRPYALLGVVISLISFVLFPRVLALSVCLVVMLGITWFQSLKEVSYES